MAFITTTGFVGKYFRDVQNNEFYADSVVLYNHAIGDSLLGDSICVVHSGFQKITSYHIMLSPLELANVHKSAFCSHLSSIFLSTPT